MKKILTVILCLNIMSAYAYSSKAVKFAEDEYKKINNCKNVYINMKKEYSSPYTLKTYNHAIGSIVYGWGDMKINKFSKKFNITYLVIYNENGMPIWSSINFYK